MGRHRIGIHAEPGHLALQAQQQGVARTAAQGRAAGQIQASTGIGQRRAVTIQHHHPGLRPQGSQRVGVTTQGVGTQERRLGEGETVQCNRVARRVARHCRSIRSSCHARLTC